MSWGPDMKLSLSTFIAGLLFGAGLTISQMVNPQKVITFLDIAGDWDPSLAFVMGAALIVAFIGYRFTLRKDAPLFADSFRVPAKAHIDARLVVGSSLFGIGWGLAGLCPGPALASLSFAGTNTIVFVAAMLGTILIWKIAVRS